MGPADRAARSRCARSWPSACSRTRARSSARTPKATRCSRSCRTRCARSGLWAPHVPPEAGGTGTGFLDYAYLNEHIGRSMWGQLRLRLPGAGRRQRRDPAHVRHRRAEGALARSRSSPAQIRSFFSMTEPEVPGSDPTTLAHARGARRRRLGDRRPQVVLVGRRRRGVRDRDGRHRPGRGPARARDADHRPRRHAGRRRRPPDRRHGPRGQGLVDALRGALHRRPRAGHEHARRRSARAS